MVQASVATAGLTLWPQIAAVPPGSNTTAVTETVQPPTNQSGTPATTAAPAPAATGGTATPVPGQLATPVVPLAIGVGPASASSPALRQSGAAGGSSSTPGFTPPSGGPPGGADSVRRSSQGTGSGNTPASGSRSATSDTTGRPSGGKRTTSSKGTPATELVEELPDSPDRPPVLAASPGRIAIGLNSKKGPATRTVVLWADRPSRAINVTAKPDWLRVTPRKQGKKGERRYEVNVQTEGLPPGRLHDGVVNVRSSRGSLTIPVVVEVESTR